MKTRYSLFSMLLLFCSAFTAQSQTSTVIIPDTKSNTTFFTDGEYTQISKSDRHIYIHNNRNPCRVFIGVGTSRHTETGGLKVDYTLDNTPATQYGVKEDDVILALDGVAVHTQAELEFERDKHKQGEAFTLDILRDGGKMTINARFKACTEEELKQAEEQKLEREAFIKERRMHHLEALPKLAEECKKFEFGERPILGIYKDEEAKGIAGVVIKEIIEGKGAEAAGLKAGDVLVLVDGKSLTKMNDLGNALSIHKAGDAVDVIYMRNGKTIETEVTLSADRHVMRLDMERDPCKVFIGVYTADFAADGKGVRVSGVIEGTAAKESAIQSGDVILMLDNQPVNTNIELRAARDKHKPGDQFRLTILRGNATMEIEATFKACPNTPDVVELGKIADDNQSNTLTIPEKTLQLEAMDAFPNPTLGLLNIRFEAEALPVSVRIADAAGKTVYSNELSQFNGYFNEQVNLEGKSPGIYTLTIQQNNKVFSKKIVLLSRV